MSNYLDKLFKYFRVTDAIMQLINAMREHGYTDAQIEQEIRKAHTDPRTGIEYDPVDSSHVDHSEDED